MRAYGIRGEDRTTREEPGRAPEHSIGNRVSIPMRPKLKTRARGAQ